MRTHFLSELNPNVVEALNTLGYTNLKRFPLFRIFSQVNSRLYFLEKLEKALTSVKINNNENLLVLHKYATYVSGVQAHIQYCKDVRSQLDINNTIDQPPVGNLDFSLTPGPDEALFQHTVEVFTPLYKHWNQYWTDYPRKRLLAEYSEFFELQPGLQDDVSRWLVKSTYASRRSNVMSRMNWQLEQAHRAGWYMVFDTLTLSPDRVKAFYENPNALRDYFRSVGRRVKEAEGGTTKDNYDDCYLYFCCPEYGSERGRLHFHCIHFLRTLPRGARDPNYGRSIRNRRQIDFFRGLWSYGTTQPIAIRYSKDAYTRAGWLWPVDANGVPIPAKPYVAIGYYVTKYVCKNLDAKCADNLNAKDNAKWNKTIQMQIHPSLRKVFRIRMSRKFGIMSLPVQTLSVQALLELIRLHHSVTPFNRVLRTLCKKELLSRASHLTVSNIVKLISPPSNLLTSLRRLTQTIPGFSLASFMSSMTLSLSLVDISDESRTWLCSQALDTSTVKAKQRSAGTVYGAK